MVIISKHCFAWPLQATAVYLFAAVSKICFTVAQAPRLNVKLRLYFTPSIVFPFK